jgi:hypothetical protein
MKRMQRRPGAAAVDSTLQVVWRKAGLPCDARQHLRADFIAIVKGKKRSRRSRAVAGRGAIRFGA